MPDNGNQASSPGPEEPRFRFFRRWRYGDHWPFALLLAGMSVLLCSLYNFRVFPHNDFIQFYQAAGEYLSGELPASYKIMPLFPALMAGLSRLLPGSEPLLHAALILSLLAGLAFLVLFYYLTRRYLPQTATLLTLVVAVNPYFLEFSLHALIEMFLLAMVTATLASFSRRHQSTYLMAGLTGLTRYDAVFLIPLTGLGFMAESRKRLAHLWLSAGAAAGFVIWLLLSALHSRTINPYIEQLIEIQDEIALRRLGLMLARMLQGADPASDPLDWLQIVLAVLAGSLIVYGFCRFFRQDRWLAIATGGFVVSYFTIHAIFKAANYRYNYLIWPFLMLFIFAGLEHHLPVSNNGRTLPQRWRYLLSALPLLLLPLTWQHFQLLHVQWTGLFAVLWLCAFLFSRLRQSVRHSVTLALAGLLTVLYIWPQLRVWETIYQKQRTLYAEYEAVAAWTRNNFQPGDSMLLVNPWVLEIRYPPEFMNRFLSPQAFPAEDIPGLLMELRKRGTSHIAWVSNTRHFARRNWYEIACKAYLLNRLGLGNGETRPCFELIAKLTVTPDQYAYIYQFHPEQTIRIDRTCIDPDNEINLPAVLQNGWGSRPDGPAGNRYLWANAESSRFQLDFPAGGLDGFLTLKATPLTHPEKSQSITVSVNGNRLPPVPMEKKEKIYSIPLPAGYLKSGPNQFTFEYSYAASPRELGMNNDDRTLAVSFKSICLSTSPGKVTAKSLRPAGTGPGREEPAANRPPLLPADTCMDPNQPDQLQRLLLDGWSLPPDGPDGHHYLWAVTGKSRLRLNWSLGQRPASLQILATPFKGDGKTGQEMRISINGKGNHKVPMEPGEIAYRIDLPADALRPGENTVEFTFRYALAPASLGQNRDERKLAAHFKKICLIPK